MMTTLTHASLRAITVWSAMSTSTVVAATINMDTVLGAGHPFPNETITVVDGANPPTNVDIVDGAVIGGQPGQFAEPTGLDVYGQSVVRMFGGIVVGTEQSVRTNDHSLFRMFGGLIFSRAIEARDVSRVILEGGEWNVVNAYDSSRVRVNGGDDSGIYTVRTFGQAHAGFSPIGFLHLDFFADESSTMVINGGSFEGADAMGNARVLINGGSYVTGLRVKENAILDVRFIDSIVGEWIDIRDSAVVNIYGTDLRFDVTEEDQPIVVGKWANGENLGVRYYLFDQGQIILHEVPEPGSWALLAVGALGVFRARRRPRGRFDKDCDKGS